MNEICQDCGLPLEHGLETGRLVHPNGAPNCSESQKLLKNTNLFNIITIEELGKKIVGEVETRQTIFLCACGKYVINNNTASYNLMQNSEAGAGKDYVLSATLSIFPKQDYLKRTRISPKVLSYWHSSEKEPDWTWDGKILYLEDVSQEVISSEVVKTFFSSGSKATILINQTVKDIEINGKPVVFLSSASATLDKEQGRRIPIISCDESTDQTRAIMRSQAEAARKGEVIEYNPLITEALGRLKRVKAIVPYADKIEAAIPPNNIILRTHFPRLLDYIKASCALHQFQRKTAAEEYLIAERQDYEFAKIAFQKTTSNQYYVPLSHKQKKLLQILEEMQKEAQAEQTTLEGLPAFTAKEIEERVNFWGQSQLYTELNKLADAGILATGKRREKDAKKDSKTYRLEAIEIQNLPDWDTLMSCQDTGINGTNGIDGNNGINGIEKINFNHSNNSSPPSTHS